MPDIKVAIIGVFVVSFTAEKHLKSNPSSAIAYKILGNGKIAPNRLERL